MWSEIIKPFKNQKEEILINDFNEFRKVSLCIWGFHNHISTLLFLLLHTVTNLTNILPDLFNKITSINEQLMPIGNISENLNRIRELIQQARDAANKVCMGQNLSGLFLLIIRCHIFTQECYLKMLF